MESRAQLPHWDMGPSYWGSDLTSMCQEGDLAVLVSPEKRTLCMYQLKSNITFCQGKRFNMHFKLSDINIHCCHIPSSRGISSMVGFCPGFSFLKLKIQETRSSFCFDETAIISTPAIL